MLTGYIQLEEATFQYEKSSFQIKPTNLTLYNGQVVFLKGSNGSGKSTLGKLIAGIHKPKTGKVIIDGEDSLKLSLGSIGKKLGYLWQKPEHQLFTATVLEELTFIDDILGREKEKSLETARKWLKYFELDHYEDSNVYQLSRGEKQRLALATIVCRGCQYLILDEPTTGLDKRRKDMLLELLLKLKNNENIGMLLISHDLVFANKIADRVITINQGLVIEDQ